MVESRGKRRRSRAVRVEDVARVAGVSPITVSRALSNPEKVAEETRRRVNDAVAKTGYVINRLASSLRSGHSTIISAFVSSLSDPHLANALQGCADALEGSRYHLLMAQSGNSDELQQHVIDDVLPFRPAAALFGGVVQSNRIQVTLRKLGIPVVEMWDHRPDPVDMLVGFSNAEGGRLVGRHFADHGFHRVAYAGRTVDRGAQRLAGFIEGFGRVPDLILPLDVVRQSRQPGHDRALSRALPELRPDAEELQSGKPIIGIAQTGSDLSPCNRHHIELAKRVREGIARPAASRSSFPVHPIQETGKRPTAALDRNLAYLGLVEVLYGYPLDGVVLTTGCDKTTPAC
jgi:DNA-binding LacI/PurR family transcriptional regulator